MHLTPQQIHFFHTFGYLGFPGLLSDRIDEITAALAAVPVYVGESTTNDLFHDTVQELIKYVSISRKMRVYSR